MGDKRDAAMAGLTWPPSDRTILLIRELRDLPTLT